MPSKHHDPATRGPIRINWTWFQYATPERLKDILRDRFGKQHDTSLAAGQLRKEVAEQMLKDTAGNVLGGDGIQHKLAKRIVELDRLFVQGIYEFEPQFMSFPSHNAILVGDAAAVATPATGMGAGKALREAGVLADLFKEHPWDVQAILSGFEKARLKETQEIVRTGAKLQSNWHWVGTRDDNARFSLLSEEYFFPCQQISKHTVWDSGVYSNEPWESTESPSSPTQKEKEAGRLEIGYGLQFVPSKL